jgi:hypothetical protein
MSLKKRKITVRGMPEVDASPPSSEPAPPLSLTCPPPSMKRSAGEDDPDEGAGPPSIVPGARPPRDAPKRRDTSRGIAPPAIPSATASRRSTRPPPKK